MTKMNAIIAAFMQVDFGIAKSGYCGKPSQPIPRCNP